MKKTVLFSLTIMLLSSCCENATDGENVSGYDNTPVANGQGLDYEDFYSIDLQQTSSCIITQIKKVSFLDSLIIILDANGVYSFNRNGNFMRRYGSKGHGHGEYINATSMWVDYANKKICLLDDFSSQILSYDVNGTLDGVRKFKSDALFRNALDVEPVDNEHLFVSKYLFQDQNEEFSLVDLKNEKVTMVASYMMETQNTAESLGKHQFSIHNGNILCLCPFKKSVYSYTDKRLEARFDIVSSKSELTDNEIEEIKDFSFFTLSQYIDDDKFKGFTDVFETDAHLFLGFSNYDYFIVNKTNNKGQSYSYQIEENLLSLPILNIVAEEDNYLVGVLYPWEKPDCKCKNDKAPFVENFVQLLHSLPEEGNPSLLFYKIK
jgi:hypothetical protein